MGGDAAVKARTVFGLLRLAAAVVCLVALIHRLAWGLASHTIASQNFFAYLTNQSNIAFVVLLSIAGVIALRTARDPRWLTVALALVLTWTITAGLVFAILVWQAGLRGIRIDVPWSDQVLHFWLPAVTVAAWALAPGHRSVPWRVVPKVALPGLLLLVGTAAYGIATGSGLVSVVSVLATLNPVVTVGLAVVVLGERLAPRQQAGVATALLGVVLLAAG